MAGWQEVLTHLAYDVETQFDRLKYRMAYALGGFGPIKIVSYHGFGSQKEVYLQGRVLEDKGVTPASDNDTFWDNLVNMYKRFESDEIPFARLQARFYDQEQEIKANEEGMFEVRFHPDSPLPQDRLWHPVELTLLAPQPKEFREPVQATGKILIPPEAAEFVVISDLDDTVLQTDAIHVIKMARNVFLGNARSRLPFPGVAAFYRALLHGAKGKEINPLFYVSSSPWNLYNLFVEVFHLHDIPIGPILFLRNWGLTQNEILPTQNKKYKLQRIRQILDIYPRLPFILIGDSGQEDPEIYYQVVADYPGRILAVYIRNVSTDLQRPEAIRELAKKILEAGSTLILAKDTLAFARHALDQGWILADTLNEIATEAQRDQAPPSALEKLIGDEDAVQETPEVKIEASPTKQDVEAAKKAVGKGAIEAGLQEGKRAKTPPEVVVESKKPKKK